jgi:exopolysaccharide biosynthesis polyprenyl glycosylphosphotransferase
MSVGIIDDVRSEDGLPLVGRLDELEDIVATYGVRRVIVAFGPTGAQDMIAALRIAAMLDLDVHVVPRFFELGLAPVGPDIEQIWGIPVYRVRRSALRAVVWKVKRTSDILLAGVALMLLAPALGLIALAVRLSSPGPVLFRQVRIGQHGRKIEVLKFRTLSVNIDSDITWSVDEDPRQTTVGKWLRRFSLDELPQLWNVLRGDMSLVGPRPERPHFVSRFSHQVVGYEHRHRLPVGLTGFAQVHGLRGDTSIEERARFDNFYIEHWSPWQDVKIIVRTTAAVLRDAFNAATRRGEAGEREEQAQLLAASVAARTQGPRGVANDR